MAKVFFTKYQGNSYMQSWTIHRTNTDHQLVPKVSCKLHIHLPLVYNWHHLDTAQDQLLKTSCSMHFVCQKTAAVTGLEFSQ